MAIYLYDDARARRFEPFALTRPAGELRVGALVTRDRWSLVTGTPAAGHVTADHLAQFEEPGAPRVVTDTIPAGSLLVNARCIPALGAAVPTAPLWRVADHAAAVRLPKAVPVSQLDNGAVSLDLLAAALEVTEQAAIPGTWIEEVWDFIRLLQTQVADDVAVLGPGLDLDPRQDHVARRGSHPLFVERGAEIEPHVLVDLTAGPVLVRTGTVIQAFTRLVGPCYVGEHSVVTTDRIAGSSIGEHCKVHGEMSCSVMLGYANKSHDGFVGHSYLGRWVNLGAGTTTSNLKNTYGPVQLWTPGFGMANTGLTFLGTMFGDYAKTGIGTRLTTGTVVGAGANIFGTASTGKFVPPFAWGDAAPYDTYALDRFLVTAERQMARRSMVLGARARAQLAAAHQRGVDVHDLWVID
jgi:UDP-N-acetylglucosamine diphosphorylase / glucose-1-phosphate thymidylyltransferase / UDP-N-acetylgalactosamine diphosphorylase / glucosamine-1-phosphate N-acetyltransferase / galactosamine-1-phosphate N-acetyltransferase